METDCAICPDEAARGGVSSGEGAPLGTRPPRVGLNTFEMVVRTAGAASGSGGFGVGVGMCGGDDFAAVHHVHHAVHGDGTTHCQLPFSFRPQPVAMLFCSLLPGWSILSLQFCLCVLLPLPSISKVSSACLFLRKRKSDSLLEITGASARGALPAGTGPSVLGAAPAHTRRLAAGHWESHRHSCMPHGNS